MLPWEDTQKLLANKDFWWTLKAAEQSRLLELPELLATVQTQARDHRPRPPPAQPRHRPPLSRRSR